MGLLCEFLAAGAGNVCVYARAGSCPAGRTPAGLTTDMGLPGYAAMRHCVGSLIHDFPLQEANGLRGAWDWHDEGWLCAHLAEKIARQPSDCYCLHDRASVDMSWDRGRSSGHFGLERCNLAYATHREDVCTSWNDLCSADFQALTAASLLHFRLLEASKRGAGKPWWRRARSLPDGGKNRSGKPPPANGAGRVVRCQDNAAEGRGLAGARNHEL